MLNIAGQLADGTVTWMAGPRTIETHITPRIARSAESSGRAAPRVTVGLPTAATDDETAGRRTAPSPTPATASWSTTAASSTSRA